MRSFVIFSSWNPGQRRRLVPSQSLGRRCRHRTSGFRPAFTLASLRTVLPTDVILYCFRLRPEVSLNADLSSKLSRILCGIQDHLVLSSPPIQKSAHSRLGQEHECVSGPLGCPMDAPKQPNDALLPQLYRNTVSAISPPSCSEACSCLCFLMCGIG
jgi:hypothetical protein